MPLSRSTTYCAGVSCARHSASLFTTSKVSARTGAMRAAAASASAATPAPSRSRLATMSVSPLAFPYPYDQPAAALHLSPPITAF